MTTAHRLLLFISSVILSLSAHSKDEVILKFGVVPQQAATQLIEKWGPLVKKITEGCECKIEFATAPDIPQFESRVQKGEYDLVYLNPMHFVQAIPVGYSALVKEQGRMLKGIIVVKKDSAIQKISELAGKKIVFPGATSFAATVLVQKLFESEKIKIEPVFVKSHDSVYLNVLTDLAPAGGGVNRTYEALPESDKAKLRILAETQTVTPHPIAVHSRVSKKTSDLILKVLTSLSGSEEGKKIMENLELKPLVSAKNSDWDDVKKLLNK